MQTLRVSATDIDALAYFLGNEDAELADLLAQLRRQTSPTTAMLAGTALHKALELSEPGNHGELSADGYTFEFKTDAEVEIPEIRELKATRDYEIDGCLVTLVGKVDAIYGKRIDDHKFTSRYDAERFLGSMQWRVYLDVFGADEFRWNVFEGRPIPDDPTWYVINNVHRLTMHRYPGMEGDVVRALARFVEFARIHLPEKFGKVDAPAVPFVNVLAAG
jgi:hypothetical protein